MSACSPRASISRLPTAGPLDWISGISSAEGGHLEPSAAHLSPLAARQSAIVALIAANSQFNFGSTNGGRAANAAEFHAAARWLRTQNRASLARDSSWPERSVRSTVARSHPLLAANIAGSHCG